MPSEEEFRRVAEDIRALAQSLSRELRDGFSEARRNAKGMRNELRGVADQARRSARAGWGGSSPTGEDSDPGVSKPRVSGWTGPRLWGCSPWGCGPSRLRSRYGEPPPRPPAWPAAPGAP